MSVSHFADDTAAQPSFCQHCYELGAELGQAHLTILNLKRELDQVKNGRWADPCEMCGEPFRVPYDLSPAPTQCRSCHAEAWT